MINSFIFTLASNLSMFSVISSVIFMFVTLVIFYFSQNKSYQILVKENSAFSLVKYLLIFELIILFLCNLIILYCYMTALKTSQASFVFEGCIVNLYCTYIVPFNLFSLSLSLDFVGLLFSNLAFFVGLISFLSLDTRFYYNNIKFIFVCNVLVIAIVFFTITNDFFFFFLMYELLLLPSFLFVYFISPGKQAIQASIYFVIWTQIGSFLVLLAIAYLLNLLGGSSFNLLRNFTFTSTELSVLMFLLFFGFGFKVPIWPFHYWITKTHVEAPTGFSIFLSGFLVKSAIYGFYKYTTSIGGSIDTTFFSIFAIMGIVDASIKMWGQTDLKKLVAYATIQEMGIIYLVFCWGDIIMIYGGVLFCITHAFLSSMFFFFVDCVNRRYNTRNIVEINGILHITPNLGVAILLGCILFSGLPGTMKFISELYIFSGLLELAPLSTLIIIFSANFLGIVGFSKVWFNAVFGLTPLKGSHLPKDLSFKEIYILGLCAFGLVLYGFWVPALF